MPPRIPTLRAISCAAILAAAIPASALAQGFAALVSPPRFELVTKPGEALREVVEITNASAQAAKYRLRTADWIFEENSNVKFEEALQPGSCGVTGMLGTSPTHPA